MMTLIVVLGVVLILTILYLIFRVSNLVGIATEIMDMVPVGAMVVTVAFRTGMSAES